MTTPSSEAHIQALAQAGISASLNILTADLLEKNQDVGDNAIWKPAKRAFLKALIREAQLELAGDGSDTPPIKVIAASHSRLAEPKFEKETFRRAHATYRHPSGDLEDIGRGIFASAGEAKTEAAAFGAAKTGDFRGLFWKQFSPTTWGLLNSKGDTNITVSEIG